MKKCIFGLILILLVNLSGCSTIQLYEQASYYDAIIFVRNKAEIQALVKDRRLFLNGICARKLSDAYTFTGKQAKAEELEHLPCAIAIDAAHVSNPQRFIVSSAALPVFDASFHTVPIESVTGDDRETVNTMAQESYLRAQSTVSKDLPRKAEVRALVKKRTALLLEQLKRQEYAVFYLEDIHLKPIIVFARQDPPRFYQSISVDLAYQFEKRQHAYFYLAAPFTVIADIITLPIQFLIFAEYGLHSN